MRAAGGCTSTPVSLPFSRPLSNGNSFSRRSRSLEKPDSSMRGPGFNVARVCFPAADTCSVKESCKLGLSVQRRSGNIYDIFFCGLGRRYRVCRRGRFACLDEAVSVVTSVSEHARALKLNPRNIHTGAPSRYYRGIIQTYLYPSPMTADMTCDRLRYRLHDMHRSLSLPPRRNFLPPLCCNPSAPPRSPPSGYTAIGFGKRFTWATGNRLAS